MFLSSEQRELRAYYSYLTVIEHLFWVPGILAGVLYSKESTKSSGPFSLEKNASVELLVWTLVNSSTSDTGVPD